MEVHDQAVAQVSERVKAFYAKKEPFRVYHGSTNSTRIALKNRDNIVDTSSLHHVIEVSTERKTAVVEPKVSMSQLLDATLPHGLVPLVVMELPGITVGGGFSGSAGESSCFRQGPFDSTVNWIEIVTPNGEILRASKTDRPDLFWGAASAFGTLGILTLLEVQLRDARDFVALTLYTLPSAIAASEKIQSEASSPDVDYLDAVVYSPTSAVVCSGRLAGAIPAGAASQTYLSAKDPWFYMDIQKRTASQKTTTTTKTEPVTLYIPLRDYLFRWDRGAFWVGTYAFHYFAVPSTRLTRRLLDPYLRASVMFHALHKSGLSDSYIIQDVGVPFAAASHFSDWVHDTLAIYPLWLCPIRVRRDGGPAGPAAHGLHADFADPARTPEVLLNFGVWAPAGLPRGKQGNDEFVRANRAIEQKVAELGGKKTLYAQAFYTEDEFWACYDRGAYERVRERYHAAHLLSVYDKVRYDPKAKRRAMEGSRVPRGLREVRPFQGFYGVYKAWRGGDYLLQKQKRER